MKIKHLSLFVVLTMGGCSGGCGTASNQDHGYESTVDFLGSLGTLVSVETSKEVPDMDFIEAIYDKVRACHQLHTGAGADVPGPRIVFTDVLRDVTDADMFWGFTYADSKLIAIIPDSTESEKARRRGWAFQLAHEFNHYLLMNTGFQSLAQHKKHDETLPFNPWKECQPFYGKLDVRDLAP